MPSKKGNKGKARKEKNDADYGIMNATACGGGISRTGITRNHALKMLECNHGYPRSKPSDHGSCARWMRAFNALLKDYVDNDPRPLNPSTGLKIGLICPLSIFATMWRRIKQGGILIDQKDRVRIINNLSASATESFIRVLFKYQINRAANATMMNITTAAILFLENDIDAGVPGRENVFDFAHLQPKVRYIMTDFGGYTIAKFLSKRTPCSCLKTMLLWIPPKRGTCYHCNAVKPAKELMLCSRCRIPQYCSKQCQKLDWPQHKDCCYEFKKVPGDEK